ncbi:unnamed protein product [Heterobilharzia americana]|nr:unnamed protein product [Heterobilharzia americana]
MNTDTPLEPVVLHSNTHPTSNNRAQFRNPILIGLVLFRLPFLPATPTQLDNTFKLLSYAQDQKTDRSLGYVIDLGSGDGRVLIDLVNQPTLKISSAHGVELNRPLVWYSRFKLYRIHKPAITSKVKFTHGDIWKTDLSVYDTVLLFGVDSMMDSIEKKLNKELRTGSIVITARYTLPNSEVCKAILDGPHSVFLYKI